VHRDIKSDNILFEKRDINSQCKIIDFGISTKFSKDKKLTSKNGTPNYIAPEVLKGSYDEKCDI
jgi:calcium-dependent protein kinase